MCYKAARVGSSLSLGGRGGCVTGTMAAASRGRWERRDVGVGVWGGGRGGVGRGRGGVGRGEGGGSCVGAVCRVFVSVWICMYLTSIHTDMYIHIYITHVYTYTHKHT